MMPKIANGYNKNHVDKRNYVGLKNCTQPAAFIKIPKGQN